VSALIDPNPGNNTASDTNTLTLFSSPYPPPPPANSANMILRRGDGMYAIYDIGNNATLAAHPLAQVGTDWQFVGLGSVQAGGGTAMFLRQQDVPGPTGSLEIYNISNNNIISAALLGHLNGQVQGFGNFGSHGENDVLLRDGVAFFVADTANDHLGAAPAVSAPYLRHSYAAGKLTLGVWDHWVPGANNTLTKLCNEWGKRTRSRYRSTTSHRRATRTS